MTARAASSILFDTAFGPCGVAWGEAGILRVRLPGPELAAEMGRVGEIAAASDVPSEIAAAVQAIQRHLAGSPQDLSRFRLDFAGVSAFNRTVYAVTCGIEAGRTLTYGEVARLVGEPGAARGVGQALGQNPWPLLVPCHRVLASDGSLRGFSAPGGIDTKRRLLALEGVYPGGGPSLFDHAGLAV
jgi:methylated-DNA-[protein]-cysteine S-methyltransferase